MPIRSWLCGPWPMPDRRGAGEPGAAAQERVDRARRDALAARRAVDVHPLGEDVVDAVVAQPLGDALARRLGRAVAASVRDRVSWPSCTLPFAGGA